LKSAVAEAEKAQATAIKKIKLVVGEATSIVPECIRFYFDLMKENTLAQTAQLDITTLPLRFRCPVCKREYHSLDDGCACGGGIDIISGQELLIEYIEVENGHGRSEYQGAKNEEN